MLCIDLLLGVKRVVGIALNSLDNVLGWVLFACEACL